MNGTKEMLLNYASNEQIYQSNNSSKSQRAAAWRKQFLLLQHSLSNSATERRTIMNQHFGKIKGNEFTKENVMCVEKMLQGYYRSADTEVSPVNCADFPSLESLVVEHSCRNINNEGCIYESCKCDGITMDDLQFLRMPNSAVSTATQDSAMPAIVPSRAPTSTTTIITAQPRNTLANFLQQFQRPKKLTTTSTTAISVDRTANINNKKQHHQQQQQQSLTAVAPAAVGAAASMASMENTANHDSNSKECNVGAGFRTAREELIIQNIKKYGASNSASSAHSYNPAQQLLAAANNYNNSSNNTPAFNYGATKKSLGARRTVRSNFVPPIRSEDNAASGTEGTPPSSQSSDIAELDERLINIDPKMIELISNEIMHKFKPVAWQDIAGLEYAKSIIKEAVVYPMLRPDIFTGLRRPPRGILLFGPPGTGKTLIGKCIASQSKSTFFSISASSLTSKWVGESEKMVRALFAVAAVHQPSVVFIDEIDSLLSQRSESEHECSRRLKTEFLIQLDGAATSEDDRVLIVAATNRPQELDEAARRRLVKRLYIPLPEQDARVQILSNLLQTVRNDLNEEALQEVGRLTDGYSGADMDSLCREASMEPIRSIPFDEIPHFKEDNVRPVNIDDFRTALEKVRPSVSQDDLKQYIDWNKVYGAGR